MDSKSEQTGKLERPAGCEEDVETAKRLAQRTLGLGSSALRRTAREMAELDAVMASDYRSLVALPSAAAARELAGLVASEFQPLHECWKGRRVHFRVKRPAPCCQEIAVHGAPYTAGAGLGLWGFSCAMKAGQGTFVIYLNTAHLSGAVAVTAAHELGHYFQHSMFSGSAHFAFAPMAADFAAHLNYAGELFSDSAAALATFSAKAAGEMAPPASSIDGREDGAGARTRASRVPHRLHFDGHESALAAALPGGEHPFHETADRVVGSRRNLSRDARRGPAAKYWSSRTCAQTIT
jgi:hypothetical protein